ncbi:MAG: glycosyltransferase family 4 protein [Cyanobacteria bacterium SZAS-4]|nr:glycosyltransferase family 4 protein [Cyanobacteria bacterium SZAS-4]
MRSVREVIGARELKALFITAAFPPLRTGGADFVHRLASELAAREVDVSVIAGDGAVSHDALIHMHRVSQKWNWQTIQKTVSIVGKVKPDVVDIVFTGWMYHDHPSISFLPTLIKRSCPNIRVIVHIESLGGIRRDKSNFARAASRYAASLLAGRTGISYEYGTLLRDSDAIITLSERDRKELIQRQIEVAAKSVAIPPPPIMPVSPTLSEKERRSERARLGLTNDSDLLLGFYGYIYPGKGIETLFEAVKILRSSAREVKLMIVGDVPEPYVLKREGRPDYLNELKKLAHDLEIYERVVWSSYAPYGSLEPSRRLRLSDVCVFPFSSGINSHNSSFWFAAAHGLPIVVTHSDSTEPIFVDRENVLFAKPNSPQSLVEAVNKLRSDNDLRARIGANAADAANELFGWTQCVNETLKVYSGKF